MPFDCKNPRRIIDCGFSGGILKLAELVDDGSCPEFYLCLPFGAGLYTKDGCLWYDPPKNPPPDGVYNLLKIEGGCIVDAQNTTGDPPIYTQPPIGVDNIDCDPVAPKPEEPVSQCCPPSSSNGACNLYSLGADQLPLVKLTVQGQGGIEVSGCGTATDPLIIRNTAVPGGDGVDTVAAGNDGIYVTYSNNEYKVFHKDGTSSEDVKVNGLIFDKYGHYKGVDPDYVAPTSGGFGGLAMSRWRQRRFTETGAQTIRCSFDPGTYVIHFSRGGNFDNLWFEQGPYGTTGLTVEDSSGRVLSSGVCQRYTDSPGPPLSPNAGVTYLNDWGSYTGQPGDADSGQTSYYRIITGQLYWVKFTTAVNIAGPVKIGLYGVTRSGDSYNINLQDKKGYASPDTVYIEKLAFELSDRSSADNIMINIPHGVF